MQHGDVVVRTSGLNWRDTYRPARFFILDARLLFVLIPTLLHLRWYTIALTLVLAGLLYFFEKRQEMQIAGAIRMVRWWMTGESRPAAPRFKRRRMIDYGRINGTV